MGRPYTGSDWFADLYATNNAQLSISADMLVVYRLNTYPLLHLGFFHFILNIIALTPLLERFEADNGSLVTLLLFTGR